ncbi:MAG: PmoA family protein [Sedimentisphaerales bacterium]|nr:PmoA family protein [Sedimentisphaerales bacterium]
MKIKCLSLIILCLSFATSSNAQKIATLEAELTKPAQGLDVPVSIELDGITLLAGKDLSLAEVRGDERIQIPFQIRDGEKRTLYWLIKNENSRDGRRVYELSKGEGVKNPNLIQAKSEDGILTIHSGDKNFLSYYYKTLMPPEGIDPAYKRSGFIHPLYTPHGQMLTRIQAPDHYHHYGIWNPWTQVSFEGETVDFWNLASKQGTVRFANFTSITEGPVFCEYQALQQHVVFKKDGTEKTALNELQSVRIFQTGNQDYYIADITSELNCATESPFLILEYRYAGLGWRATEKWDKNNSEILTSEGKTRKDADGSLARWCIVQGQLDDDYGGAVMMSYPANYNHPEPLRVWPENMMNDRGDVYANFCPTKNMNWQLDPGQRYVLKYRFVVFNGHFTKEKAESAWQYYAASLKITVKMN